MLNNSRIKTAIDLARLAEIELEDAMKEYMDRRSAAFMRIMTRVDYMLKPCLIETAFCDMVDVTAYLLSIAENKDREVLEDELVALVNDRDYPGALGLSAFDLVYNGKLRQALVKSIVVELKGKRQFSTPRLLDTLVPREFYAKAIEFLCDKHVEDMGDNVYLCCFSLIDTL